MRTDRMNSATRRGVVRNGVAAAVLVLGGLSYLTRSSPPAAIGWLHHLGLSCVADRVCAVAESVRAHVHLPSWLSGSASDAAYGFALGAFLVGAPRIVIGLGFVVALGHEVAQGFGLADGTFDPRDLMVITTSFALAHFAFYRKPERTLHDSQYASEACDSSPLRRSRLGELVFEEGRQ